MKESQQQAARRFAEEWKEKGYERGDTQPFWLSLLRDVYDVERPEETIVFEKRVRGGSRTNYIDCYISRTRVLIEQKSVDVALDKAICQSDGTMRTPFEQAKNYIYNLPVREHPNYIITCNFREFWVYDMNKPLAPPEKIQLKDLATNYHLLQFLVDKDYNHTDKELDLSVRAGDIVGQLYDAFIKQYKDPTAASTIKSLNVLCVRLVFCLYAEKSGLFGEYGMFCDYLRDYKTRRLRCALIDLFRVLNTEVEKRDPYLPDDDPFLAASPYVDGGLFSDETIEIPPFTEEIRSLLLDEASMFSWADISPTIFGAVFESTLNPATRRAGGMHYTSIESIHKVIDPLFLDDLRAALDAILDLPASKERDRQLRAYQQHLASLTFFDPACGSGNFLTETYISLRQLENEVLRSLSRDRQIAIGGEFSPIQVSIAQFYGIEINDFAVAVARTALWIAEHQMVRQTEEIIGADIDFLPLKSYTNIVEGNALRLDWQTVVPRETLNYIMGNPPFSGARLMSDEQKEEVEAVFAGWNNVGNLDYVACWYKKAADLMKGTTIRAALVATNSISQGEQAAILWQPLLKDVHIDFAYRTFRWVSEAVDMAHVHCVIIGFSSAPNDKPKVIYDGETQIIAQNINGYLRDETSILVTSRTKPLCDVPEIGIGNQPIDDGNYLFTAEERDAFVKKEPRAAQYFHPWYGADEFINCRPRYCLWLGECSPAELRSMPRCLKRVAAVRQFRLASRRASTVRLADMPTRFQTENMPQGNYIVIPETSSEQRKYVPIGFLTPDVLCSNALRLMPDATLYHFGVLTSKVHNAWLRAVGGRLEVSFRYSKNIVYNNFPWPMPTAEQRQRIEQTAHAILAARAQYPDSSLADLYDEDTMPSPLRTAHQANDAAVCAAYGWDKNAAAYLSESACVAALLSLYHALATRPAP